METECDVRSQGNNSSHRTSKCFTDKCYPTEINPLFLTCKLTQKRQLGLVGWRAGAHITQSHPSPLSGRPKSNSQARYQTEQPGAVVLEHLLPDKRVSHMKTSRKRPIPKRIRLPANTKTGRADHTCLYSYAVTLALGATRHGTGRTARRYRV